MYRFRELSYVPSSMYERRLLEGRWYQALVGTDMDSEGGCQWVLGRNIHYLSTQQYVMLTFDFPLFSTRAHHIYSYLGR